MTPPASGTAPAVLPLFGASAPDKPSAIFDAAQALLRFLEKGRALDARTLRGVMCEAFGASDAGGAWTWKDAYEASEGAQVLFLKKFYGPMARQAGDTAGFLTLLGRLSALTPSHTRRSEESQAFQQFSTPLALGFAAAEAAQIGHGDLVLEPSAGLGLLAVHAHAAAVPLVLNELADTRRAVLKRLFPDYPVLARDAEHIDDFLPPEIKPSVVLMNPPFSASPGVVGRRRDAVAAHVASALARLAPGGRLVAITPEGFAPHTPSWRDKFVRLQERGQIVFTCAIDGSVYARHGASVPTRLLVIDRTPAEDRRVFPQCAGTAANAAELLELVQAHVPPRQQYPSNATQAERTPTVGTLFRAGARSGQPPVIRPQFEDVADLEYQTVDWTPPADKSSDALYEPYVVQSIRIEGAKPHPTPLVQSAAMASVPPPKPTYRPTLPRAVVTDGLLSDAQLESLIHADEAHERFLDGTFVVDEDWDQVRRAMPDDENAVRFRKGWFLGDGTGAGKGRQVAGVILDNWLKGRRRAVWVSKSDKLIEDARRDWSALGGDPAQIVPLSKFKQGAEIYLREGILFCTYATLRSAAPAGKASRVEQVVKWLGHEFDGALVFDEAHAMANAAGGKGQRGEVKPSQQGRAGLRLQNALPGARVLYVSATGATTVANLAYASRLGLWGTDEFPFATRGDFVSKMEAGGVAAMEVISRDLKALGLYAARSLSFAGVEYEMLVHELTPEQTAIYDAYADAFQIIHANLHKALEANGISKGNETYNRNAKAAALSAFESSKQRFFGHLLTAMKCPTLIKSIENDLENDHAAVVQIVSTGEALMERRLSHIPAADWDDLQIDVTPREAVVTYLSTSFPTQLFQVVSDEDGNLTSEPVFDADGNPVECREAARLRDQTIERLMTMAPVPGALDQIVQHFGEDAVAEVTGRSRRIVRRVDATGERLCVQNRPASANYAEAHAFMDDAKRILVFSDAGGTGRSYHADLGCANQRLRVHYMLEPGWRADNAIQGLGRTNRTNQAQPPLFRPVATDVKGEKRFLSTIARRLDTLGAITRGQRQTGGQGLFRAEDNLESPYAKSALRKFYRALARGSVDCCSLTEFVEMTGLKLLDEDGTLKEDLPPIHSFLNRVLALRISVQNAVFDAFMDILEGEIEAVKAAGLLDVGLETLSAEKFEIAEVRTIFTHAASGAETRAVKILRTDRNRILSADDAMAIRTGQDGRLMINGKSGRAAVMTRAPVFLTDEGAVEERVRLHRPHGRDLMNRADLEASAWREADEATFRQAWEAEVREIPPFTTSAFHLVTGLLLPIWDRLPELNMRVYRLETADGQRLLGRKLDAEELAQVLKSVGAEADTDMTPAEILTAVMERGAVAELAAGLRLKRSRVMGAERLEVLGADTHQVDGLKALGCTTEIVNYRLALYLPLGPDAVTRLGSLLERFPLVECVQR